MTQSRTSICKSDLIQPTERVITTASKEHGLTPIEIVTYESETVRENMYTADAVSGLVFRVTKNRDQEGIHKLLDFIDNSCNVTALEIRFMAKDSTTSNSDMDCLVGYSGKKRTVALTRARDEALKQQFICQLRSVFLDSDIAVEEAGFRTTGPRIEEDHWKVDVKSSNVAGLRRTPE